MDSSNFSFLLGHWMGRLILAGLLASIGQSAFTNSELSFLQNFQSISHRFPIDFPSISPFINRGPVAGPPLVTKKGDDFKARSFSDKELGALEPGPPPAGGMTSFHSHGGTSKWLGYGEYMVNIWFLGFHRKMGVPVMVLFHL